MFNKKLKQRIEELEQRLGLIYVDLSKYPYHEKIAGDFYAKVEKLIDGVEDAPEVLRKLK